VPSTSSKASIRTSSRTTSSSRSSLTVVCAGVHETPCMGLARPLREINRLARENVIDHDSHSDTIA